MLAKFLCSLCQGLITPLIDFPDYFQINSVTPWHIVTVILTPADALHENNSHRVTTPQNNQVTNENKRCSQVALCIFSLFAQHYHNATFYISSALCRNAVSVKIMSANYLLVTSHNINTCHTPDTVLKLCKITPN